MRGIECAPGSGRFARPPCIALNAIEAIGSIEAETRASFLSAWQSPTGPNTPIVQDASPDVVVIGRHEDCRNRLPCLFAESEGVSP
jgi:hypothetical protein